MSSSSSNEQRVNVVEIVTSAEGKATLARRLTGLSSHTEMKSYGVEQWQFLLDAGDVSPLIVPDRSDPDKLLGCVLRIGYGLHAAYGMMLVSPEARGQGLARKLLERAMSLKGDMHILGTCTEMGRPFYEKMGYRRVSTVTRMTVDFSKVQFSSAGTPTNEPEQLDVKIDDTSTMLDHVLALDARATGLDRSKTINAIQSYPYVKTATISDQEKTLRIAALITHHTGAPFVMVGPILGEEKLLPQLILVIRDHYEDVASEMALIISDHVPLVAFLEEAGFTTAFELGAMTTEGIPMPGNRDLYLGLIHPTLG